MLILFECDDRKFIVEKLKVDLHIIKLLIDETLPLNSIIKYDNFLCVKVGEMTYNTLSKLEKIDEFEITKESVMDISNALNFCGYNMCDIHNIYKEHHSILHKIRLVYTIFYDQLHFTDIFNPFKGDSRIVFEMYDEDSMYSILLKTLMILVKDGFYIDVMKIFQVKDDISCWKYIDLFNKLSPNKYVGFVFKPLFKKLFIVDYKYDVQYDDFLKNFVICSKNKLKIFIDPNNMRIINELGHNFHITTHKYPISLLQN